MPVGGVVYILEQAAGSQERHISSIHKLLVKSAFSKHFTQIQLKTPLRYPLRQNLEKSSISSLSTPSKITTIPPKIPSNHWKISILSNLTENTIFNKEITHQKPSIYNSLITQNTSKSNTFHYTQSANNIHLSKSYFLSLTPYQKFTSTHQDHTTHQSQSTKQYHTPHSLPAIIRLNH